MLNKERLRNKRREETVEIDIFSLVYLLLVILMVVLLLFLSLHFVKKFIPVRSFEIVGDSVYEPNDLALASGVEIGEKIFRVDIDEAEKTLLKKCPYIKTVNIKRNIFGKVRFVLECYIPLWYVEISGDCYVLDGELRVLEETTDRERLYESGLVYLTIPHIKSSIVGDFLIFGNSDGETEETKKILQIILDSPANEMICSADIDNRYDVHFEFDKIVISEDEKGKEYRELDEIFTVNAGGYSKLATKLEYVTKAIMKEDLEGAVGGIIDVSDEGDKVSIRTKYASGENN